MILSCENCVFLRTTQGHASLQIVLLGLASAASVACIVLVVRGIHRQGLGRVGVLLAAAGMIALPLSLVPMVRENVVAGPYDARVYCDKPLYAPEVLHDPDPSLPAPTVAVLTAELEGCRSEALKSFLTTSGLLLGATALLMAGLLASRRGFSHERAATVSMVKA